MVKVRVLSTQTAFCISDGLKVAFVKTREEGMDRGSTELGTKPRTDVSCGYLNKKWTKSN